MTLNSTLNTQQLVLGNITTSGPQSQQSHNQEEPGQTSINSTVDLCFCGRPVRPAYCNLLRKKNTSSSKCLRCESLWTRHRFNSLEYDWMFFLQGYKCAVEGCNNPAEHLDHCHDTNIRRQVLCFGCNASLGNLNEDIIKMIGLIRYKLNHI